MSQYTSIIATDADQSITIDATAAGLTLTLPAEYSVSQAFTGGRATVQVRTAPILYTLNGTAPTAADESTGLKLNIGDILVLTGLTEMRNLKMIRATGTSGAVFVTYEKKVR